MDNQHTKITGYRDLTQGEIDLMNEIKAKGQELEALVEKVRTHINGQLAPVGRVEAEYDRLKAAEPGRWASIARTDFQTGLMALTRAVAQPTSF